MNNYGHKITEWFLRIAISAGFLSAVADRFSLWPKEVSAWGNWDKFQNYTHTLLPFLPDSAVVFFAGFATALEVIFGILLLTNFKTPIVARLSGLLLITFGICMAVFNHVKAPLDYSVFTGAAACFALALICRKEKYAY